jgi:hypothetical protein
MPTNDHIPPIRPHTPPLRIPTQRFPHIKRILFIPTRLPSPQITIILPHSSENAIPQPFIQVYGDSVCAADVEVDEEASVGFVGDELERVDEVAGETESAEFGGDGDGSYVAVPFGALAFSFAYYWDKGEERGGG